MRLLISISSATSLPELVRRISEYAQGRATHPPGNTCWLLCGQYIHEHQIRDGYLLLFGDTQPVYVNHTIVVSPEGHTRFDSYAGVGSYSLDAPHQYTHTDGVMPLIRSIPVSFLLQH